MNKSGSRWEEVTFIRDCDAIIIPDGFRIRVPQGTLGVINQLLGGNYTIRVDTGYLVRIDGSEADAIGKEVDPALIDVEDAELDEDRILEVLSSCYDPEIPVNIVDLGLIYGCDIVEVEDESVRIDVQMTLTAPGCGMGQVLKDDVERRLTRLPGVVAAEVELVFDPPWTMERMTEEARLELGFG
ncbi:MAG: putative Fe-S cluster assembly protein SufT [Myxococcales bacterium]|nr:putative Fe-S cluster assembly protein SufT [Myxococcales bacterium]